MSKRQLKKQVKGQLKLLEWCLDNKDFDCVKVYAANIIRIIDDVPVNLSEKISLLEERINKMNKE